MSPKKLGQPKIARNISLCGFGRHVTAASIGVQIFSFLFLRLQFNLVNPQLTQVHSKFPTWGILHTDYPSTAKLRYCSDVVDEN